MEKAVIFISSSTLHPLQSIGNKPPEQPVGRVFHIRQTSAFTKSLFLQIRRLEKTIYKDIFRKSLELITEPDNRRTAASEWTTKCLSKSGFP